MLIFCLLNSISYVKISIINMIKTAFQIALKNYTVPIFKLQHLEDALIQKTIDCKKFKNYLKAAEDAPANIKL